MSEPPPPAAAGDDPQDYDDAAEELFQQQQAAEKAKKDAAEGDTHGYVEQITDRRVNLHGAVEYLCKWFGEPEASSTWESAKDLDESIVNRYEDDVVLGLGVFGVATAQLEAYAASPSTSSHLPMPGAAAAAAAPTPMETAEEEQERLVFLDEQALRDGIQASLAEQQRAAAQSLGWNAMPLPPSKTEKRKTQAARRPPAAAGGHPPGPTSPDPLSKRSLRKAPGPAAVAAATVRLAALHLKRSTGMHPVGETGVIRYPYELHRREPLSTAAQNALARPEDGHMGAHLRLMRDECEAAAWTGPMLEDNMRTARHLGYGNDTKPDTIPEFVTRQDYAKMSKADKRAHELQEQSIRQQQIIGDGPSDIITAGQPYPLGTAAQLPDAAVQLLWEGANMHLAYRQIIQNRKGLWDRFTPAELHGVLATTGMSGPLAGSSDGRTFFLRAVVWATSSQHVQFGVFGTEGIKRMATGIGLTKAECKRLHDQLIIRELITDDLIASIARTFPPLFRYNPTHWAQCMPVGMYVMLTVQTDPPLPTDVDGIDRHWLVTALKPAQFQQHPGLEGNPDKELISAVPEINLCCYAILQRLRTDEALRSGKPSSSYDVLLHLGMEQGGPVGAYLANFVPDPLDRTIFDINKPHVPDISPLEDGCLVAVIGVSTSAGLLQRGLPPPLRVPQVLRFCVVATEDVQRLMHGRPHFYESWGVNQQLQFLSHHQSATLAVTHCHRSLLRAYLAKGRAAGRALLWDLGQLRPRLQVSLPVLLPHSQRDNEALRDLTAVNADCRFQIGDWVRVLIPSRLNLQNSRRGRDTRRLEEGNELAWEHSFTGRVEYSTNQIGISHSSVTRPDEQLTDKHAASALVIVLSASDRGRLKQVCQRTLVVLEAMPREWLAELHFTLSGSAVVRHYQFLAIRRYADLSKEPAQQIINGRPLDDLWVVPPRGSREGLVLELKRVPGRTCGNGATARSLLGMQYDPGELVSQGVGQTLRNLAAATDSAGYLCMRLMPDLPDRPARQIQPTQEQLMIATRLNGTRPNTMAVHGPEGSGKTTTALMMIQHYLRNGRAPFTLGSATPHQDQRHVLVVCADLPSADAFCLLTERLVTQLPKPDANVSDCDPNRPFPPELCFKVTDRESPVRVLRLESGLGIMDWDLLGVNPAVAHMRLEARVQFPTLEPVPDRPTNRPIKPSRQKLLELYLEHVRVQGLERGITVEDSSLLPDMPYERTYCRDYTTAYNTWQETLKTSEMQLANTSSPSDRVATTEVRAIERALFYTAAHAFCHFNANVIVVTAHDLENPLLRFIDAFDQIYVDDAQAIPLPQMLGVVGVLTRSAWEAPPTQVVMLGNDSGRLPVSLTMGVARMMRCSALFTSYLRAMEQPIHADRPYSRLGTVCKLSQRMRIPDEVAAWAQPLTIGQVLPAARYMGMRPPMPRFIKELGVSAQWKMARESLELIDLQAAKEDVSHPLYGRVNGVQFVILLSIFEILKRNPSYTPSRALVVTHSEEFAQFLRGYVAAGSDALSLFPPICSYEESHGRSADLLILAATTVFDNQLYFRAKQGQQDALDELEDRVGWLADVRALMDVLQRGQRKVIVLTHCETMRLLKTDVWRSLQRCCAASDSYGTASLNVWEARVNLPGLADAGHDHAAALADYLRFTRPVDEHQLTTLLLRLQCICRHSPVSALMLHDTWSASDCRLTKEARYYRTVRPRRALDDASRTYFTSADCAKTFPSSLAEVTQKERHADLMVDLGVDSPYFASSAPRCVSPKPAAQPVQRISATVTPAAQTAVARRAAETALAAASVSRPAAAVSSNVDMMDEAELHKQTQLEWATRAYAQLEPGELVSPPPRSLTITPSTGSTNASSLGDVTTVREHGIRGSRGATTAADSVDQLRQRQPRMPRGERRSDKPKDKNGNGVATKMRSPASKRVKLEPVSSVEAAAHSAFPGATLEQLMPPPVSVERSRRTSVSAPHPEERRRERSHSSGSSVRASSDDHSSRDRSSAAESSTERHRKDSRHSRSPRGAAASAADSRRRSGQSRSPTTAPSSTSASASASQESQVRSSGGDWQQWAEQTQRQVDTRGRGPVRGLFPSAREYRRGGNGRGRASPLEHGRSSYRPSQEEHYAPPRHPSTRCRRCGFDGHHESQCNTPWCTRCSRFGHPSDKCPKCPYCYQYGHPPSECTRRAGPYGAPGGASYQSDYQRRNQPSGGGFPPSMTSSYAEAKAAMTANYAKEDERERRRQKDRDRYEEETARRATALAARKALAAEEKEFEEQRRRERSSSRRRHDSEDRRRHSKRDDDKDKDRDDEPTRVLAAAACKGRRRPASEEDAQPAPWRRICASSRLFHQ